MKKQDCERPYQDYFYYVSLKPTKNEGRYYVYLVHKQTGKKTTLSLARYRLSVKLGRILEREEHVDHIDGDKTNDSIENLQILSPEENRRKSLIQNNVKRTMISLKCANCNEDFQRRAGAVNPTYTKYYCSRRCLGIVFQKKTYHKNKGKSGSVEEKINSIKPFVKEGLSSYKIAALTNISRQTVDRLRKLI